MAKAYRNCADTVRTCEVTQLRDDLSKQEYDSIKSTMWAFRMRFEKLKESEQELYVRLFTYSLELKQAYELREALTQIVEHQSTKNGAKCAICAWCQRVLKSEIQ